MWFSPCTRLFMCMVFVSHMLCSGLPVNQNRISYKSIVRFPIQKSPRSSAQGIIRQLIHYDDVIMRGIASQSTSLMIVYSTVYSSADQRKHQSSASLAFVWGIHRDRWIHRTKGQLRGKCFHLMTSSWSDRPCLCLHSYQNSYQECYPINQIWNINCYNTLLM